MLGPYFAAGTGPYFAGSKPLYFIWQNTEPGLPLASGSGADGSRGAASEEQDEGDREVLRLSPLRQLKASENDSTPLPASPDWDGGNQALPASPDWESDSMGADGGGSPAGQQPAAARPAAAADRAPSDDGSRAAAGQAHDLPGLLTSRPPQQGSSTQGAEAGPSQRGSPGKAAVGGANARAARNSSLFQSDHSDSLDAMLSPTKGNSEGAELAQQDLQREFNSASFWRPPLDLGLAADEEKPVL